MNKLSCTSGFGDFEYCDLFLRREHDIKNFQLCENDFVIVSSDGLLEDIDITKKMLTIFINHKIL